MSLIFSRRCEYALQAMMYLSSRRHGEITSINDIADKLAIPYHFLGKILQQLANKGLLTSRRGHAGGFTLAQPAEGITLLHIIEGIDGTEFMNNCLLGFQECSSPNPCALHKQWSHSREGILSMLKNKNIAEMAKLTKKERFRLHLSNSVYLKSAAHFLTHTHS
jgi:Rrf2 family iron-sulfur cluster assembly transcriptional regulator